ERLQETVSAVLEASDRQSLRRSGELRHHVDVECDAAHRQVIEPRRGDVHAPAPAGVAVAQCDPDAVTMCERTNAREHCLENGLDSRGPEQQMIDLLECLDRSETLLEHRCAACESFEQLARLILPIASGEANRRCSRPTMLSRAAR